MGKGFKDAAGRPNVYAALSGALDTETTASTENTADTQATKKKQEYYRFNLKMPVEYKDYLQEAAYRASSPAKMVTITEYICDLIKADMEKDGK